MFADRLRHLPLCFMKAIHYNKLFSSRKPLCALAQYSSFGYTNGRSWPVVSQFRNQNRAAQSSADYVGNRLDDKEYMKIRRFVPFCFAIASIIGNERA
jgi:hypothetical protein